MKTNVEVDDALVTDALKATGLTTQHEVVELALKTLIQIKRQGSEQPIAPQEKAARFSQWAKNHAVTAPLSDAAVSRESIYTREDEML